MYTILLLLIIAKVNLAEKKEINEKENDFPPNEVFNYISNENNQCELYIGSQLSYLKFNCTLKAGKIDYLTKLNYDKFNISDIILNEPNNCQGELYQSFGEIIFVEYEYLSFCMILFGFLIILYGTSHFYLSFSLHMTLFLYFIIKDMKELYHPFINKVNPLFILTGSLITGIWMAFYFYLNLKRNSIEDKIFNTIYGCLFGFFFFKALFYYILIATPSNDTVYVVFLYVCTVLGGIIGFFARYSFFLKKFLLMICSSLAGSFYIMKGVGFIIGGYYSDIITCKKHLTFNKQSKRKLTIFCLLQIFLFISSLILQFYYLEFNSIIMPNFAKGALSNSATNLGKGANASPAKGNVPNSTIDYCMNNTSINNTMNNLSADVSNDNSRNNDSQNETNNIYDQED